MPFLQELSLHSSLPNYWLLCLWTFSFEAFITTVIKEYLCNYSFNVCLPDRLQAPGEWDSIVPRTPQIAHKTSSCCGLCFTGLALDCTCVGYLLETPGQQWPSFVCVGGGDGVSRWVCVPIYGCICVCRCTYTCLHTGGGQSVILQESSTLCLR